MDCTKDLDLNKALADLAEYEKQLEISKNKTRDILNEINDYKNKNEVLLRKSESNKEQMSLYEKEYKELDVKLSSVFMQKGRANVASTKIMETIAKYTKMMVPAEVDINPEILPDDDIDPLEQEKEQLLKEIEEKSKLIQKLESQLLQKFQVN